MSPGDADSYSESVTQSLGGDVNISASAYLPIKKLQSSTAQTDKFPEECEECEHPTPCGFVDPEGDPCQVFGTRVTTTTQYGSFSNSFSCDEGGLSGSSSGSINATIVTTETCEGGSIISTTEQSGSSSGSASYNFCDENSTFFGSYSCNSTLTNDGWSGSSSNTLIEGPALINTPCIEPTVTNTTFAYSNPIERCCDGYAPVGPNCECVYIGG